MRAESCVTMYLETEAVVLFASCQWCLFHFFSAVSGRRDVVINQGDEIRDGSVLVHRCQWRSTFRQQAHDGPRPL